MREGKGHDLTVKHADVTWYLIDGGAVRQFTLAELRERYELGAVRLSSSAWTKGMPEWAPISSIKALRTALLSNENGLRVDVQLATTRQPLAREPTLLDDALLLDAPDAELTPHKRAVLVPTWMLRLSAVALLALSAFVLVPKAEPPTQARPKLVLSRESVSEPWVAISESRIEPTHLEAVHSVSTYDSAPALDQYARYADELSRLEGLPSCAGPKDVFPCEGYQIAYVAERPSATYLGEKFLQRRATPAEIKKLIAMGHVKSQADDRKR